MGEPGALGSTDQQDQLWRHQQLQEQQDQLWRHQQQHWQQQDHQHAQTEHQRFVDNQIARELMDHSGRSALKPIVPRWPFVVGGLVAAGLMYIFVWS